MKQFRFDVTLTLDGPALSQASGALAFGMDAAARRAGSDNRPAYPGSLVAGNLRHAWSTFAVDYPGANGMITAAEIDDWLGKESFGGVEPQRRRLCAAESWIAESSGVGGRRNRISESPDTGAVTPGALQIIDAPHAAGETVILRGAFGGRFREEEAKRLCHWLRKGLQFVPALGAFKGVGFGRLRDVSVAMTEEPAAFDSGSTLGVIERADSNFSGFAIALAPDRPICFAKPRNGVSGDNRFVGEDFIPGGAIKGALARVLREGANPSGPLPQTSALGRHFESVRITHGFPASMDTMRRPVSMPLSLVADGHDNLWDVALCAGPGLIGLNAPAFQSDWKGRHWAAARNLCGWPELYRRLEEHNKIAPGENRPVEKALFSKEGVVPDGLYWLAHVDLSAIQDPSERRATASDLMTLFAGGLNHLGKTGARVQVTVLPREDARPAISSAGIHLKDGVAVVTLQTAAALLPHDFQAPPTNGGNAIRHAYGEAWKTLSDGCMELKRYFACQALSGGKYAWQRFRKDRPYNPDLLTLPGSVFVLECMGDKKTAEAKLAQWLRTGVPNADGTSENWKTTPHLRANGFAEIHVNLNIHWERQPKGEVWHALD